MTLFNPGERHDSVGQLCRPATLYVRTAAILTRPDNAIFSLRLDRSKLQFESDQNLCRHAKPFSIFSRPKNKKKKNSRRNSTRRQRPARPHQNENVSAAINSSADIEKKKVPSFLPASSRPKVRPVMAPDHFMTLYSAAGGGAQIFFLQNVGKPKLRAG